MSASQFANVEPATEQQNTDHSLSVCSHRDSMNLVPNIVDRIPLPPAAQRTMEARMRAAPSSSAAATTPALLCAFPDELLLQIFCELPAGRARLSLLWVCRRWRALAVDFKLWPSPMNFATAADRGYDVATIAVLANAVGDNPIVITPERELTLEFDVHTPTFLLRHLNPYSCRGGVGGLHRRRWQDEYQPPREHGTLAAYLHHIAERERSDVIADHVAVGRERAEMIDIRGRLLATALCRRRTLPSPALRTTFWKLAARLVVRTAPAMTALSDYSRGKDAFVEGLMPFLFISPQRDAFQFDNINQGQLTVAFDSLFQGPRSISIPRLCLHHSQRYFTYIRKSPVCRTVRELYLTFETVLPTPDFLRKFPNLTSLRAFTLSNGLLVDDQDEYVPETLSTVTLTIPASTILRFPLPNKVTTLDLTVLPWNGPGADKAPCPLKLTSFPCLETLFLEAGHLAWLPAFINSAGTRPNPKWILVVGPNTTEGLVHSESPYARLARDTPHVDVHPGWRLTIKTLRVVTNCKLGGSDSAIVELQFKRRLAV